MHVIIGNTIHHVTKPHVIVPLPKPIEPPKVKIDKVKELKPPKAEKSPKPIKEPKIRVDKGKKRNKYDSSLPKEYKSYLMRANKKGLPFELSVEEFYNITRQNCYYCGEEGANGIDRQDSKQGYTLSNSLPCCSQCNMMKYTYSIHKFLSKVKQIYNYQLNAIV